MLLTPNTQPLPLEEARLQLRALLQGEADLIANCANFCALLAQQLPRINWLGFYFVRGDELVLGPFQGNPACVRIAAGKGVCGQALAQGKTLVVDDVHAFPGHIACDLRSRSELVVPLRNGASLYGVLDIDSPAPARFTAQDVSYVEALLATFAECQFPRTAEA